MSRYTTKGFANFSFQNTWGGIDTTSSFALPIIEESLTEKIDRIQVKSKYSRFSKSKSLQGKRFIEGAISFNGGPLGIVTAFKTMFDQQANVWSGGLHKYTLGVHSVDYSAFASTQPLTIEVNKDENDSYFFQDLQGQSLNLGIATGELVKCDLGLIGRNYVKASKTSATFASEDSFKWDQCSVSLDGVANPDFLNLNINVTNNLEARYTLQTTNTPHKIKRTEEVGFAIDGTVIVQSNSLWTQFTSQLEHQLIVSFESGIDKIEIDIPSLRLIDYSEPTQGGGVYEGNFIGEAFYNQGSNSIGTITTVTSYLVGPAWFTLNDSYYGLLDQDYNFLK